MSISSRSPAPVRGWRYFLGGVALGILAPILVAVGLLSVVWSLEQMTTEQPERADSP